MAPARWAMACWMSGMMPPPTTIIMKMPEACSLYLPRPSTARLKMAPHMMEVQIPQTARKMHFIGTAEPLMVMLTLSGRKMAMSSRRMASEDTKIICVRVLTLPLMKLLRKRPTIIRNQ